MLLKVFYASHFSNRFANLLLLDLRTLLSFSLELTVCLFSSIPTYNLPCYRVLYLLLAILLYRRTVVSVWTLSAVLQPISEVDIVVCAVSVRLVVVVGGGAHVSVTSSVFVTSSVSGLISSFCVGSFPSVVWLSVVMVMTVFSSGSLMGSVGKDLLVPASPCCCLILLIVLLLVLFSTR